MLLNLDPQPPVQPRVGCIEDKLAVKFPFVLGLLLSVPLTSRCHPVQFCLPRLVGPLSRCHLLAQPHSTFGLGPSNKRDDS